MKSIFPISIKNILFSNLWRLRVLLVTLIVSAALVLAQPRRADAYIQAFPLVLAYWTVMGVVCTPIAAIKASDYPGDFSGALEDCIYLKLEDQQPSSTEINPSHKPTEAAEETLGIGDDELGT
jgi:hypothetical protein